MYAQPDLANQSLDEMYSEAKILKQKMSPPKPQHMKLDKTDGVKIDHRIDFDRIEKCESPHNHFGIVADPYHEGKAGIRICNRMVLFQIDFSKKIGREDVDWAWHHPILMQYRTNRKNMQVCRFCKASDTPFIRSINHEEYKRKRDEAIRMDLSRFQDDKRSPSGSICLLDRNIMSVDQ